MQPVDLSVVVLTWNTREMTAACIRSLLADPARRSREIIVVDNASDDGTAELLRARFPGIRVIESPENVLYAAGNNLGVRESRGRYVCILNSDTEVEPGALDGLIDHLEADPRCAIAAPRLVDESGVQRSCRRELDLLDALCLFTPIGRIPAAARRLHGADSGPEHEVPTAVDHAMGACLMLRRDDFHELGGFHPRLTLYFNDHELCRQARLGGRTVVYCPQIHVRHLRGESTRMFTETATQMARNGLAYYRIARGRLVFAVLYTALLTRWSGWVLKSLLAPRSLARKRDSLRRLRLYWRAVLAAR